MIEGLKVTVSGTELAELCRKQAEHHAKRAEHYQHHLEALKNLNDPNTSNRPGEAAEQKIKTHEAQAAELQFIADHLQPQEAYLLDSNDLYKIGVSYRGY